MATMGSLNKRCLFLPKYTINTLLTTINKYRIHYSSILALYYETGVALFAETAPPEFMKTLNELSSDYKWEAAVSAEEYEW